MMDFCLGNWRERDYLRIMLTRAVTSDTLTLPSALISASSRLAVSPLRIIFTKVVT